MSKLGSEGWSSLPKVTQPARIGAWIEKEPLFCLIHTAVFKKDFLEHGFGDVEFKGVEVRERHSRQREQHERSPGKCGHMCMSVCVHECEWREGKWGWLPKGLEEALEALLTELWLFSPDNSRVLKGSGAAFADALTGHAVRFPLPLTSPLISMGKVTFKTVLPVLVRRVRMWGSPEGQALEFLPVLPCREC